MSKPFAAPTCLLLLLYVLRIPSRGTCSSRVGNRQILTVLPLHGGKLPNLVAGLSPVVEMFRNDFFHRVSNAVAAVPSMLVTSAYSPIVRDGARLRSIQA
jgi:hypothetical protein